jgi:hypothetical protein
MRRVQEGVRLRSERSDGRKIPRPCHSRRMVTACGAKCCVCESGSFFKEPDFYSRWGMKSLKSEKAALHYFRSVTEIKE